MTGLLPLIFMFDEDNELTDLSLYIVFITISLLSANTHVLCKIYEKEVAVSVLQTACYYKSYKIIT